MSIIVPSNLLFYSIKKTITIHHVVLSCNKRDNGRVVFNPMRNIIAVKLCFTQKLQYNTGQVVFLSVSYNKLDDNGQVVFFAIKTR